jgi:hypothetical protein
MRSIARPCTAGHAKNSVPGRHPRGRTPVSTSPSSATPSNWKWVRPPPPALAGLAALHRLSDAENAVRSSPGSAWAKRR